MDRILDFAPGEDAIWISSAGFGGVLAEGALDPGNLTLGKAAVGAGPQLVYNRASGALLWDADGAGGAAAVRFATLVTKPAALDASDFLVVA